MPDQTQVPRVRIPGSVAEMLPPKKSSLITEAASFIRSHYTDLLPYYEVLAGERPSKHGKYELDEAEYVFAAKELASANGYAHLGAVITADFLKALRFGFRRNTGEKALSRRMRLQHKERLIEDRRQPQP